MPTGTVRLHRVLRTKPEKVYRAFLDADATCKWLPPYGFTCKVHHMDARVGGTFKMSFHNFRQEMVIRLAGSISNSCQANSSDTPTSSTIRICQGS